MCCEISELFTRADVCVARYLSCSLKQTYVLRDIRFDSQRGHLLPAGSVVFPILPEA